MQLGIARAGQKATETLKSAENTPDLSSRAREDYEKYSAGSSAAINATCSKTRDGGGLSATKVSLRWSMMRSTTA